jgi:hypothetical protein
MKFRNKLVKFTNFETPSPNFAAPSASILLQLISFKFQSHFNYFIPSNIINFKRN